jgi:hypothetical protein
VFGYLAKKINNKYFEHRINVKFLFTLQQTYHRERKLGFSVYQETKQYSMKEKFAGSPCLKQMLMSKSDVKTMFMFAFPPPPQQVNHAPWQCILRPFLNCGRHSEGSQLPAGE